MTANQIAWQEHLENVRHNTTTEGETNRHNVVTEVETNRTNLANEDIKRETNAINKAHYERSDAAAMLSAQGAYLRGAAGVSQAQAAHDANIIRQEGNEIQREWNADYGNILRFQNVNKPSSPAENANAGANQQNADTNQFNAYENAVKDASSEARGWFNALNPFKIKGGK